MRRLILATLMVWVLVGVSANASPQVKTLSVPETDLAALYALMHDGMGAAFDAEFFTLAGEYGAVNIVSTVKGYAPR